VKISRILWLVGLCFLALLLFYWDGFFILEGQRKGGAYVKERPAQKTIAIYLVNLERSQDRLKAVTPLCQELGFPFYRINAVDGYKLTDETLRQFVDCQRYQSLMGRSPYKGEVGCALSHIKIWKALLESPYSYALVLEDDVAFSPVKLRQLVLWLLKENSLWDICNLDIGKRASGHLVKTLASKDGYRICQEYFKTYRTSAYLINRKAARQLFNKALPLITPIDLYYTRHWELGVKYTTLHPSPVTQDDRPSTVAMTSSRFCPKYRGDEGGVLAYFTRINSRIANFKSGAARFLITLFAS
jgi:glycosyl transferase family 25